MGSFSAFLSNVFAAFSHPVSSDPAKAQVGTGAFIAAVVPVVAAKAEASGIIPVGSVTAFTNVLQGLGAFIAAVGVSNHLAAASNTPAPTAPPAA